MLLHLATVWKEKNPLTTNNYRLLVIDIDGTLISKDATVSHENKEALGLARERGIAIALSTGRTVTSCQRIIDQLALEGYHIFLTVHWCVIALAESMCMYDLSIKFW